MVMMGVKIHVTVQCVVELLSFIVDQKNRNFVKLAALLLTLSRQLCCDICRVHMLLILHHLH